ncbi:hypothetical protein ScPMuIL_005702 [Solemya velum]
MATSGPVTEKALKLLRNLPRVTIANLKDLPGNQRKYDKRRGLKKGRSHGRGTKGQGQRMTLPRLGFEGGNTPFYLKVPQEPYYRGHHLRREYPPLSLLQLQRMIDLGRIDADEPIDLTTLCNTNLYHIELHKRHFGVNLTDEGADVFAAKVNIEVQWTDEVTIAAIERNGGTITTRYFDPLSLAAVVNPLRFFSRGIPIPKCKLPPEDALEFYMDPKNRGYLADQEHISEGRLELAQKYGYKLTDIQEDPMFDMLTKRKNPSQVFFGLNPGWIVNLKDKCVIKPVDEQYKTYYAS